MKTVKTEIARRIAVASPVRHAAVAALRLAVTHRRPQQLASEDAKAKHDSEYQQLQVFIRQLKKAGSSSSSYAKTAEQFASVLDIQASKGNYDADAYMHGMLNGMVLMAYLWAVDVGLVKPEQQSPFVSAPPDGFSGDKKGEPKPKLDKDDKDDKDDK